MQPNQTSTCDDYGDLDDSGVQKNKKRKKNLLQCFSELETPKLVEGKHIFFWKKSSSC